jgi:lipoprotein-anchoring transpeptidase ErfK/SrfK
MYRVVLLAVSPLSLLMLGSASSPAGEDIAAAKPEASQTAGAVLTQQVYGQLPPASLLAQLDPPPPPPPPTAQEALAGGTLIVVSIPSQEAFVFKRGEFWDSSPVSTGKLGKETPTGEFTILQKKKMHRSTLYDDAPMPFMQRLTWGGVALHAGRVPGYPASHGCIRLPKSFAERLYGITNYSSTVVLVTDEPLRSAEDARVIA